MPDVSSLIGFVAAALVVLITPGPGVLYVIARSLSQGQRAGLVSVLGLSSGALVHVAAATLGLSAILLASAAAFTMVKLLGAFREWKQELAQYSSPALRSESERQLDTTRRRYEALVTLMKRAAARMDPILATFRDQVLFLKHNLNARAVSSLGSTQRTLEADISRLISEMENSIREAEVFIRDLKSGP